MKYILDTNIIICFLNGRYPAVAEHLRHIPAGDIAVSTVTLAELEFGARKSCDYRTTAQQTEAFTKLFEHVLFDERAAKEYGRIRYDLNRAGTPIGANDMMIAASALVEDAVLVTHNVGEFSRVTGLVVEDWTE